MKGCGKRSEERISKDTDAAPAGHSSQSEADDVAPSERA